MATYRTAYSGEFRLRIDVDVMLQSENMSAVRTCVYLENTGGHNGVVAWRAQSGRYARETSRIITGYSPLTLLDENIDHYVHDNSGAAPQVSITAWIWHFYETGGYYPERALKGSFTIPKINRLPSAPSTITFTQSLAGIVATSAGAAPAPYGGAPVLGYQIEHTANGAAWPGTLATMSGHDGMVPVQGFLGDTRKFRARAKSVAGWGPWSADRTVTIRKFLGYRMEVGGTDVIVQTAERYLGGGKWTPCTVAERATSGTAWAELYV